MIINPYSIKNEKKDDVEKFERETVIEDTIRYLADEHKELVEKGKVDDIKNIMQSYFIAKKFKLSNYQTQQLIKDIINKIFGYGILQDYINDEITTDIRVVKYNKVYIKQMGKWIKSDVVFESDVEFNNFIRYSILKNGGNINYENPIVIVSDRLNHLRIEAGIDPVNIACSSIVIRIHKGEKAKTLEHLFVKENMLNKEEYEFVNKQAKQMKNILLVGKGGSGKTTLLRAIIEKLPENIAITTNEETAELYIENKNVIQREILIRKNDDTSIDLEKLTRHSLVMSNDVIVIGELKGKEASAFFDAISTGHTGYTTVHADSIENSVDRLVVLIKKDPKAQSYTDAFLRRFIVSTLDFVIYMKDYAISEIASLDYDESINKVIVRTLFTRQGEVL